MLEQLIIERIRSQGPIPVDEYMQLCLTHPAYGYYTRKPAIFGKDGDFITSPEISSVFGEIIGAFLASMYRTLGSPTECILCEGGPGTGKCLTDVIRGLSAAIDLNRNGEVVLIEISERLRKQQRMAFAKTGIDEKHLKHASTVQELNKFAKPLLFYANEWLDALPPKQYQRKQGRYYQTAVGINERNQLTYTLLPEPVDGISAPANTPEGGIIEINEKAEGVTLAIAEHLHQHGGVALFIDYGYQTPPYVSTLQAVQGHQRSHPFLHPGTADLTTLINFSALTTLPFPERVHCSPVMTQRDFLVTCGIEQRIAQDIIRRPHQRDVLTSVLNRLIGETEMGTLFKAFFLTAPVTQKKEDGLHPLILRAE